MSNGYDEAWPVYDAVDKRDAGGNLEDCAAAVWSGITCTRWLFSPETLTFLHKGGRIGGAAALLGNAIKLVPILTVIDGAAETFAKVRTRKKALERMVQKLKEDMSLHGLKRLAVHYIGDKAPALEWARDTIIPLVGHEVPFCR